MVKPGSEVEALPVLKCSNDLSLSAEKSFSTIKFLGALIQNEVF